ncbi:MAG TPA: YhjD/YihY/BrkB family envelope integrity protein [Ornithinibacter sp.]|nr:YhjD/YihY/BrkB family envelope integrity protein [Ornithinibacter sp.]
MRLPNVMDEDWFPRRCLRCFFAIQGIDRAMVIASQAFTALIPLVILTSALLPTEDHGSIADTIVRKFALTGDSANAVQTVFAPTGEASIGLLSLLLLLLSGVSLSRRLQRMYLEAWQLPRAPSVRASLYAAFALAALIVEIGLLSFIRSLLRELPFDAAAGLTGSLLSSIVVWTSIPWLLLNRRVAWQRLLPAGLLAGGLSTAWGYATTVYMPRLMSSYSDRYGLFGVTIALVGWLLCISFIIVATTALAAEFDRAPERWATRLRYPWTASQLRPDRTPDRGGAGVGATAAGAPSADDP